MSNLVLQQFPALVGVGVGALATYATTSLAERSRWRRERSARWDEARMRAYADYGNAVRNMSNLALRIMAGRGLSTAEWPPLDPDAAALETLATAETERGRAWEAVLLLGNPDTVRAAREWHQAVWCLEWFARGMLTATDQFRPAKMDADRARDKFYEAARQDLGVKGRELPIAPWPPAWMPASTTAPGTSDGSHDPTAERS